MRTSRLVVLSLALLSAAATGQVLLAPSSSSGAQRLSTFDPFDGSLINLTFINGAGTWTTPKNAIDSGRGTIFISDQVTNSVYEYSASGSPLGTFVGASQGLANIRGIAVRNSQLYVTVGGGSFTNTIQRFDIGGPLNQTTWAGGLSSPFDIIFRANDVLVSNSNAQDITRLDFSGTILNTTWNSPTTISFVQQLQEQANGDIAAAGFSVPAGLYIFDSSGVQQSTALAGRGLRGIYRLGNGNWLFTDGSGVFTFNPGTSAINQVAAGSYQYIEFSSIPAPGTGIAVLLGGVILLRRRR